MYSDRIYCLMEECHFLYAKLDGVTSQKTVFFIVTSDLVTASRA